MGGKTPTTVVKAAPRPERPITIEAPKPVVKAPVKQPTPAPAVTRAPAALVAPANGHSDWVVQVASTRSQADAAAVWTKLKTKFPRLVEGKYGDVVRVDLEAKGIYYRTRVAGLADKSAASALCSAFKAADQPCFVAKK